MNKRRSNKVMHVILVGLSITPKYHLLVTVPIVSWLQGTSEADVHDLPEVANHVFGEVWDVCPVFFHQQKISISSHSNLMVFVNEDSS